MNYLILNLVPFALALTAFAGEPSHDGNDIQGTWLPTKALLGGEPMKDDFLKNTILKLDNGKYEVTVAGSPDKGTYTIDPAAQPKTLDITGTEGPNVGRKIHAIYQLRGDTLLVCYALGASARPSEFKSPSGTQYFLVTYSRKGS
jgi:uncharacterized protein (TIGR03067 family)